MHHSFHINTLSICKFRAIDLDSLVLPSVSADLYTKKYFAPENTSYEYESYGVPFTQSNSTIIPSSTTMGDCSDPSTFKVAIIDSGYMVNHPDSPCLTDANNKSNCIGYSFVADPWNAPVSNSHGTHVMGIIGSLGDSGPYTNVGVIPTRNNICYVIYRVFDESRNGASWSNVFAAVERAVLDQGAKVINMSLGGGAMPGGQAFFNRAFAAGTLTVAASGNDGRFVDKYPASYNDVISVGAINNDK
jgi:serine protease